MVFQREVVTQADELTWVPEFGRCSPEELRLSFPRVEMVPLSNRAELELLPNVVYLVMRGEVEEVAVNEVPGREANPGVLAFYERGSLILPNLILGTLVAPFGAVLVRLYLEERLPRSVKKAFMAVTQAQLLAIKKRVSILLLGTVKDRMVFLGLVNHPRKTDTQVAKEIGCTREFVSRINVEARRGSQE